MARKVRREFFAVMKPHLQSSQQGTQEKRQRIVDDPSHWRMALPTRVVPNGLAERSSESAEWRPRRHAGRGYERAVSEWWWI